MLKSNPPTQICAACDPLPQQAALSVTAWLRTALEWGHYIRITVRQRRPPHQLTIVRPTGNDHVTTL
jgi:hypothetical protein